MNDTGVDAQLEQLTQTIINTLETRRGRAETSRLSGDAFTTARLLAAKLIENGWRKGEHE